MKTIFWTFVLSIAASVTVTHAQTRTTMNPPSGCNGDECLRIQLWDGPLLSADLPSEVLQHFQSHDGVARNWNRVAYTEWVVVGDADCDGRCFYLDRVAGALGDGIQLSVDSGPEAGYKKIRIGLKMPSGCSNYQPFFEVKDASRAGRPISGERAIAYHDPHVHPIQFSRVHVHRVYGDVGSFVFQNEHSANSRSVRMGALLTC